MKGCFSSCWCIIIWLWQTLGPLWFSGFLKLNKMYVRVFQSKCLQISLLVWLLNISHIKCLEIEEFETVMHITCLVLCDCFSGLLLALNCILLREKKEAVEYLFQKNNKVGLIYINHRLPHRQRVKEVTMKTFLYLWRRNVWFTLFLKGPPWMLKQRETWT